MRVSLPLPEAARVPVYLTDLIGRDREIDEVRRLLGDGRLVSLVGAGGSGKTRLAAAVAAADEHDRVAWVDLTSLNDPGLVAAQVGAALGLWDHAATTPLQGLIDFFGAEPALLVLDNCEHLVASCARLVDPLLRGAPALRVLVTSHQALGVSGEKVWPVPPLSLPGEDPSTSGAVRLFVERARDVLPDFALTDQNAGAVSRICRRLDGLPLAIELAAARVRLLPPAQLAGRLDSALGLLSSSSQVALPRHRTLRALMDWSYALLSPEERTLLRRLAVFAGGFTLEGAEEVAGCEPFDTGDVLDLLAALVDRSLVTAGERQGEARYTLLETVRQYAFERLGEEGEVEALRARHARYFLELAEEAEPHVLGGTRGTPWMTRLEHESANLRAAMEWCGERAERVEMQLRFGAALHWFHFAASRFGEPRRRLDAALAAATHAPPRIRGRALAALGYLAFWLGDHGAVHAPLRTAVELLRHDGDPTDLAFASTGLATIVGLGGDPDAATRWFDEAEGALGDPAGFGPEDFPRALLHAFASYWRGVVAEIGGDVPLARASYERSVRVARLFGSHPSIAHPLTALARTLVLQGDPASAHGCLAEAVPIHVGNEDRWGLLQAAEAGALLALAEERPDSSARLIGAADRIRSEIGAVLAPHEEPARAALVARIRSAMDPETFERAHAAGADLPPHATLGEMVGSPWAGPTVPERDGPTIPERAGPTIPERDGPTIPERADLRARALGPVRILVDERPLSGDALAGKPRELLLLLLTHPAGLTREQVGLVFWPEATAPQVKNSFHVTLHRLRKAIGHPEWIDADGDRYRVSSSLTVDFDARAFEEAIGPALRQPLDGPETAGRLRAILALYGGDFLDGEIARDWHLGVRQRLRRRYVEGQLALGRFDMAAGRLRSAAEAFRAVLAADHLHEEAYRELMACLAGSGARTEALRLYRTLTTLLRDELGTEPDGATHRLYAELLGAPEPSARVIEL